MTRYDFKIINCAARRTAINIRVELVFIESNESENGKYPAPQNEIDIHNDNILSLNRHNKRNKESGCTERVSTHLDLDEILAARKLSLRLSVIATDSFSGVTNVFEQSFPDKSLIKLGLHEFGDSVNVSPQPDPSIQSVI
jgi:O-phosphoseryl-tRNA(Cys) synthetase